MDRKPPVWWKRVLRTAVLTVGLVFTLGMVLVLFFENSLIYFPIKGDVGPSPGEEVHLTTSDGVKIHGWYAPHLEAKMTILWFHGNAGNIENRRSMFRGLRRLPANVFIIDYRGYGKSEGKPDEPGLYLDARAAYDWLCTRTAPEKIIVLGKSLGSGPACELASKVPVGGLIVQSTFTKAPDMASRVMPFFPARYFMRTKFDNIAKVAEITCPKLFIHSRDDEMIPFKMGERLFDAAAEPKEHAWFDRAGHNDLWDMYERDYTAALKRFLDGIAR